MDTGNLGVSALGISILTGIAQRDPDPRITLFDFRPGSEQATLTWPSGQLHYVRRGAYRSRRFHRPENLRSMYLAARLAPVTNPTIRSLDRTDLVLDITGGDSFTDLYGPRRFVLATMPKRIVLRRGRPLHLLPQTYGPFSTPETRRLAARIVAGARTAWARDQHSYDALRELAGDHLDPHRHRLGVDVAFLLPAIPPSPEVKAHLGLDAESPTVIGVNVSGLLTNEPDLARARFRLKGDYLAAMTALVERFVEQTDATILLVPHVKGSQPHDADDTACARLAASLDVPERVRQLPAGLDAMQTKGVIGRCDWFVGARMHATIAALSQQIPAVGVAYSDKFAGVFASCGVGDQVVDARATTTGELVDAIWERWERRTTAQQALRNQLPAVLAQADQQFDAILASPER